MGLSIMDKYDLNRFVEAQEKCYRIVLDELMNGKKQGHWMWFVFPQMEGLGSSEITKLYSIKSLAEAGQYLSHNTLGSRLLECCEILLNIQDKDITQILGFPDDMKLKSSMTLFSAVLGFANDSLFERIISSYFDGEKDLRTMELLKLN